MKRKKCEKKERDQCTQEEREKRSVWDRRRKRRAERGRRSVQIPQEGVEKCDLVPRPGDISSTQLIDF